MRKGLLLLAFVFGWLISWGQYPIISQIADPADNYLARYVQLYNPNATAVDLTNYLLGVQPNGGAWTYINLQGQIDAGGIFVIAADSATFASLYGAAPNMANSSVNGNGNDAYALFYINPTTNDTVMVDLYGQVGVDGTGTAWDYTDGVVYRMPTYVTPDTSFDVANFKVFKGVPAKFMLPLKKTVGLTLTAPSKFCLKVDKDTAYLGHNVKVMIVAVDTAGNIIPMDNFVDVLVTPAGNLVDSVTVKVDSAFFLNFADLALKVEGTQILGVSLNGNDVTYKGDTVFIKKGVISNFPYTRIFDENKDVELDGWLPYTLVGNGWYVSSYNNDYFLKVSNYNSATRSYDPVNAWYISPMLQLPEAGYSVIISFANTSYGGSPTPEVLISTDYPGYGDPTKYTWDTIKGITWSSGGWTWVKTDPAVYVVNSTQAYIAFVFNPPANDGDTWEIDSIQIDAKPPIPAKLAVLEIEPPATNLYANREFSIDLQVQSKEGYPAPLKYNTTFKVELARGTGTLTASDSVVVSAGDVSLTIDAKYSQADSITLKIYPIAGDTLDTLMLNLVIQPLPTVDKYPYMRIFDQDKNIYADGWYPYTIEGNSWYVSSYNNDYFVKVSNYNRATGGYDPINAWFISPKFIVSNAQYKYKISFNSISYGPQPTPVVMLSTDYDGYSNPTGFTWTEIGPFTWSSGGWTPTASGEVEIQPGADFYIAFVFNPDPGTGNTWEIDSIQVQEIQVAGIDDPISASIIAYPNPTNSRLTIVAEKINKIEVLDYTGRIIETVEVNDSQYTLDLSGRQTGIYILRIWTDEGVGVKKILKF